MTYQQAVERYTNSVHFDTSGTRGLGLGLVDEWYTPGRYLEAARAVLGGIDLDPASSAAANTVIKATQFFSIADDGLSQPWAGRIWMNPPYATPLIDRFCARLSEAVMTTSDITQAVVLVNNATETKWFVSLVNVASALCFPTGRVSYWSPRGVPARAVEISHYGGPVADGSTVVRER